MFATYVEQLQIQNFYVHHTWNTFCFWQELHFNIERDCSKYEVWFKLLSIERRWKKYFV